MEPVEPPPAPFSGPDPGAAPSPPSATAALAEPPPRRRVPWWGKLGVVVVVLLFAASIAGFVVHVPYSTISPGDAVSLDTLVHVEGAHTYSDERGDIRLLFVRERNHVSLWRYVIAKLDKNTEIFKDKELNPDSESQSDLAAQAAADMNDAKISATKVALEAAGYTVKPAPGFVVEAVLPSLPASKALKAGDIIVSADGKKVLQGPDLTAAVRAHRAGDTITLGITRDGKPLTVHVGIAKGPNGPQMGVRVFQHYNFPVHVTVDTAGIGGPSGGLAMTLAILDDITPGNLTGGARVAVTGTIDPVGNVGEIGGIEQKAVAARARHAKLFIVPQCLPEEGDVAACQKDLAAAQKRAGSGLKVIPVATFAEALAALRANGGAAVVKVGPTLTAA
jgi:Lon-like protease